ncbi:DUF2490 domain-containing protein [Tunturibacter psychrotolerans]|uniref:DUF2490 domain-containing protein n=1 Tax=Tunturiibacter psychrotolerans TaxID=3069686 RepID=A0AAU7ZRQ8_9BACT
MSLPKLTLSLALLTTCTAAALAQQTEALPELDPYLKVNASVRFRLQAANTREGGDPTQLTIGPDLELYLKPLVRLKKITAFDLDEAKARPLIFTEGYRYLATPGSPSTNRMVLTITGHYPLRLQLLLTDRNRADLDWTNGTFKWRYRNRLQTERPMNIRSYHPIPYISAEVYYQEQYQKWGTTELYAGCLFPIKKRYEFDLYYEHQNNTGKSPNSQLEGIGLKLNMFFSVK